MRLALIPLIPAMILSGCVVVPPPAPVAPVAAPAPVTAPAPLPRPAVVQPAAVSAPTIDAAPVPAVAPPAPAPALAPAVAASGPRDARTGLPQAAVVAVTPRGATGHTVLFRPAAADAASIAAAPGKLCGAKGVADSATNTARSGSAMPGVQIMIVNCKA